MVETLPAMHETQVRSLGWEDPLEKEMAAHSSILAWRIPRTEEPGGLGHRVAESDTADRLTHTQPMLVFAASGAGFPHWRGIIAHARGSICQHFGSMFVFFDVCVFPDLLESQ